MIAGVQVATVRDALGLLPALVPVFVAFLLMAALTAMAMAMLWRLPVTHARTLAFSLGTRNSFVVLPFAVALPQGW